MRKYREKEGTIHICVHWYHWCGQKPRTILMYHPRKVTIVSNRGGAKAYLKLYSSLNGGMNVQKYQMFSRVFSCWLIIMFPIKWHFSLDFL